VQRMWDPSSAARVAVVVPADLASPYGGAPWEEASINAPEADDRDLG
jgi:hypothetical protein